MDDIKTMYQKVKEIFTTEHHIDLDTDNMLTEQLFTDYISSQLEPLVIKKPAEHGGQITRPNIKDFFPDKTLQEMMLIYKNNESLFNYIKKLDAYIDELESRLSV